MSESKHSPGPWEYVASNEHHGPYVVNLYGGDVCDCYVMSNTTALSVRNGGDSMPIHFADADANARLIAAAPDLLAALQRLVNDSMFKDHPEASQMAIDAISKATGAQS